VTKYLTVEDYIGALPVSAQKFAVDLRETILAVAPNAVEEIRYDMPSFRVGKSTVVYFACWKKHAGLYPIYKGDEAFEAEVGPYRAKKDTVQLLYSEPLPRTLLTKIVRSQLASSGDQTGGHKEQ
jgi:uncharacterized protein YdhG (YjbR/CyaY superfamily)